MGYGVVVRTDRGEEVGELEGVDGGPAGILLNDVGLVSVCGSWGHLGGNCAEVCGVRFGCSE